MQGEIGEEVLLSLICFQASHKHFGANELLKRIETIRSLSLCVLDFTLMSDFFGFCIPM